MSRDIDAIIAGVRKRVPDVVVSQLQVKYPGSDDDGLWFFDLPGITKNIQAESSSGQCPFIIEHDDMQSASEAWRVYAVDEAVEKISAYLAELATDQSTGDRSTGTSCD